MIELLLVSEDLFKSHVKGHLRGGKWVSDYDTKAAQKVVAPQYGGHAASFNAKFGFPGHTGSLFGGLPPGPPPKPKAFHPKPDDAGKQVGLFHPHLPNIAGFANPNAMATFTPGMASVPAALNDVPLSPWADAPTTDAEWASVEGQKELDEPPLMLPHGCDTASSGLIIAEPDGRVWVVSPTNRFGGYKNTFPKGKVDDDLPFQANAIKEAYEESGLKCRIIGLVGDVRRSTSMCRYYLAVRTGGSPAACGWESQAVHLVPGAKLRDFMDSPIDKKVVDLLGSQPAPQ